MCGIYKITNLINGKIYIGQSIDIKRRWKEEKRNRKHDMTAIRSRAFQKYGVDSFHFDILEECPRDKLNEREKYWIAFYRSSDPEYGYNMTAGGDTSPHCHKLQNLDTVLEIINDLRNTSMTGIEIGKKYGISDQMVSDINHGRCWPQEHETYPIRVRRPKLSNLSKTQKKLMELYTNHPHKPRKMLYPARVISKEDIIASFLQGKSISSARRLLRTSIEKYRAKLTEFNLPTTTDELKYYFGIKKIKIPKPKTDKKVIQMQLDGTFVAEYESLHEAARQTNCMRQHIADVCHGRRKTAYGYTWQFKN